MLRIEKVTENKKQYIDLLLLADEQMDMIDRYLESGDLFALYDASQGDVHKTAVYSYSVSKVDNFTTDDVSTADTISDRIMYNTQALKSVCVVVPIDQDTCELKNIATNPADQGRGYASALIKYISDFYKNNFRTMLVGTGETPTILSFYENCGFVKSHKVKNFFTDNYDHPMFEDGVQLVDMIYLKKVL